MGKLRGDADLAHESFRADRCAELLPQHLDRNLAFVLPLLSEMYSCHPTGSQESLYRVAIGERRLESERRLANRGSHTYKLPSCRWACTGLEGSGKRNKEQAER